MVKGSRIAFLLPANGIAGGVFVVYEHANRLQKAGYDVHVFFEDFDPKISYGTFGEVHFKSALLSEAVQFEGFDLAIATWWQTCFNLARIPARQYAYFVQSDERRFYPDEMQALKSAVALTYNFRHHLHYITEAKWIQNLLKSEFGVDAHYAPNGVNTDLFCPDGPSLEPRPQNGVRVLIEGPGSVSFKRVDAAFRAVERIRKAYPEMELWYVCSDGYVEPHWHFDRLFTKVPYQTMPEIYRSCHVLLKLSSVEGFFGPPLEMMACGGTAVISDVTGYDEYAAHEHNALVAKQGASMEAAAHLERLLKNFELRHRLSAEGIQTGKAFSWESQHPHFAHAVETILNQGSPKASLPQLSGVRVLVDEIERYTLRSTTVGVAKDLARRLRRAAYRRMARLNLLFRRKGQNTRPMKIESAGHDTDIHISKSRQHSVSRCVFVGQREYFRSVYYDALESGHLEFSITSGDTSALRVLPDFVKKNGADCCIVFRPEWLAEYPEVVSELKSQGVALVGYSTEPIPHSNLENAHPDQLLRWKSLCRSRSIGYDLIVHYDQSSQDFLEKNGFSNVIFHPLPVSQKIFFPENRSIDFDACFLGRSTAYREEFLGLLKSKLNVVHVAHGLCDEEARQLMCRSKYVINIHNENYPNFENRCVQALFCGRPLLSQSLTGRHLIESEHYQGFRSGRELLELVQRPVETRSVDKDILEKFSIKAFVERIGQRLR